MLPNVLAYPMGGNLVGLEYANRLVARGHDVVVACGRPTPEVIRILGLQGVVEPPSSEAVPPIRWFDVDPRVGWVWYDLSDSSSLPEADVLFNAPVGCDRSKGLGVGVVQGVGVWSREVEDAVYLAPGPKLCVSLWVYEQLRARGVPAEDLAHIPNGVDTGVFRVTQPIERRPRRVAMLHHYLPIKGTDLGLAALERAKGEIPDLEAILFGIHPRPGNLPHWLEYAERPSRTQLSELYNSASIVLCPSRGDGFYLCGLEGAACGCAVASTDIGGVKDYAESGVTALLSPPEDSNALGDHVIDLATNSELRARLANAGALRAASLGWDRATDQLIDCFSKWLRDEARS